MSFWYLTKPDLFLIDLDDYMRPAPSRTGESRGPWGEVFFRRRLADGIRAGVIPFKALYLDRSNSERHWHAIVVLDRPMKIGMRLAWQQRLGSDLMRSQADQMRSEMGVKFPSLLIRNRKFRDFPREPDRECACTEKHDTAEQAELGDRACPVWLELRGMTPWQLFGPTLKGSYRAVKLRMGEVPLEEILRVDETAPEEWRGCEF